MSGVTYTTEARTTTVYIAIPDGPRYRGKVKEFEPGADPDGVHPGLPHRWHRMLHYGQPGTGFVHCYCGAMGVPYRTLEPLL